MVVEYLKKIATLFMTALLLVSSTGVVLQKHYCMGRLKDVSLFSKASTCLAMMGLEADDSCPMSCCQDTSEEYKVDNLEKTQFAFDSRLDMHLLAEMSFVDLQLPSAVWPNLVNDYRNYKPPLIDRDVPILVQSFLI